MFGMSGTGLAYRNRRDPARAPQLRGLTRRRTAGSPADHLWMPMSSPDMWRRDTLRRASPPFSRFEELDDEPLLRSSSDLGYSNSYSNPYNNDSSSRRSTYSGRNRERDLVPFDKAADALYQALQYAIKHCKGIKEHFEKEVVSSTVSLWAPPKIIDALWAMKLDWDGVDLMAREKTTNQQPAPDIVTYRSVVKRLMSAFEDMASCGRPRTDVLEEEGAKLSPYVFRNTMSKLHVTVNGVEELMQSVRKDRSLMEPLIKDLTAAMALLSDIEELWQPKPSRIQPSRPRARASWVEDEVDEDDPWPSFREV